MYFTERPTMKNKFLFLREYGTVPNDFFMKIRDLVNFDMLFPNMQRKIYLRDLVFEIFTIKFRPFFRGKKIKIQIFVAVKKISQFQNGKR